MDIFNELKNIKIGEGLDCSPIMLDKIDSEAMAYLVNSNSDDVKKFLPGAYVSTAEQSKEKIDDYINRMLFRQGILYCLRPSNFPVPIGYILLNAPESSVGLGKWSIDFWLQEKFRGKGIMASSVFHTLKYFQQKNIDKVVALVDRENFDSIKLLEKVGFTFSEEEKTGQRYVYEILLN